ncbi:TIGR04423 family type III CRISPR-associated protein [Sodaliphilus sp.]|uniref:TIGR04423 family type III CRISPR-associated protein n=1 Tax=Sodaliphilus sp. TaxID=2815818 RepID=UPI00388E30AD
MEQRNYEGYVWMSDESKPKVYNGGEPLAVELIEGENPFVIEALLCDKANHVSYSVKYVDGKYIITRYEFESADFNRQTVTVENFVGHRMEGHNLQFLRYWEAQKDPICLDMPVLHPTHLVFTGFTNTKTQEK